MENSANVAINGFTVIPILFDERSTAQHYLYIKEHSVRDADELRPSSRTLFVVNLPPYVTEESLATLFKECGKVTNVFIQKKPTASAAGSSETEFFPTMAPIMGYKVAYIVFQNAKSVQKAMNMSYSQVRYFSTPECRLVTGLQKWMKEKRVIDEVKLKIEVETFLQEYDSKREQAKADAKKMDGVADEDGWVTVTRHGRNKAAPRTESHQKKVHARERRKRKNKELMNFYSFQVREGKREHIAKLREKFEEDKKRIEQMKQMRRFKPY